MSTIAALIVSATVAGATIAWVKPRGRPTHPRSLPVRGAPLAQPAPSCPAWFARLVEPAALPVSAEQTWLAVVGSLLMTAMVAGVMGGLVVAVLAVAGLAGGIRFCLHVARHRRDFALDLGVADTLDAIARSTRSGRSVVQALADLDVPGASLADRRFAAVAAQVERGSPLPSALTDLARSSPAPGVRLAATALIVGSETGAAPARAVEGVAATVRDRMALDRELSAQASQARASVAVLVFAPLGFGLFAMTTEPRVAEFLLGSPLGWICVAGGLGLNGLGAWWMRRIMASAR